MKTRFIIALFAIAFTLSLAHSQNPVYTDLDSGSKFSFVTYGGIGYAVVDNDNQPKYNLNANTADFLINYRIGKRYGIATGIGFDRLSGNAFNAGGNFYHERGTLRIPVLLSVNYNIAEKVRLMANIGLYGKTVLKDEYSFVGGNVDDIYEGWNFGFQSGIGLAYNFYSKMSLGIMFSNQADFTRLDSDQNSGINDEQKIAGLNTVGLLFGINF
ncbi:hypothetical protein U8527_08345 [Kordia algicida OT-1]|uniref:Outer membrane protein beta-barrel domain-containing protein n=1 Tax=Kordia algicida OT-1 TaxID=391587 RepID=A9E6F1_9FLAO|nr:hypothetical protein [Kordia algicida]EDP95024.1 hypothetical protein KAOT1_01774 [Kordia algicida OT-1]